MSYSRSPEGRRPSHRDRRSPSPRYERSHGSSRRPDDRRSARYEYDRDYRRDRERDRYRDRSRERYRDDDRYRDGERYRERDRDRDRDVRSREDDERRRRDDRGRDRSPKSSPAPATPTLGSQSPANGDKPKTAKERLEAWKRQRELQNGKAGSSTPEPAADNKPSFSAAPTSSRELINTLRGNAQRRAAALPAKPTGFSRVGLSRVGLPMKPGSGLKKSAIALDDEESSDRKLEKLDLPEVNPEVQSGEAADLGAIGEDMAAEEDEEDVKQEAMEVDAKPEEEEDPLEAFMKANTEEVKQVNVSDARRLGLLGGGDESDDETEIKNKQEEELEKAEAILQMAATKSRKKDLPEPDHKSIDYEPFRKAFYNPPVDVLEMTEEEVDLMRLEMDGIKIRGQDAPRPVKNWGAFGLPMACLEVIRKNAWETPTNIQAQTIPAIMSGRNIIGIAKTGSGKTLAFLLPMFRHVKDQRPVGANEGPIALVISPTRELAMQTYREAKPFLGALGLRASCTVGGQSISEDIAAMKKGSEIVICTPGRMIDLLTANNGRVTNLRRCTYLVLDEADRMFDMGFEPQIDKINKQIRPEAQRVLFSATFPSSLEGFLKRHLGRTSLEITVGGRSVVAAEIDQRVEVREADTKFNRLLEILGEQNQDNPDQDVRCLVFVDRQDSADDLFRELLQRGYVCASLHGGKEQVDRDEAIKNFKSGDVPIIVATSVAARGLDVKELKLVINYDAPNHLEDYVHRAGRTGRAGNTGVCITFVTPEQDKFAVDIVRALEASKAFVPPELKEMSDKFLAKIKSGKAKASSGFSGKGLDRIERKREEKDRAEKVTYGDTSEAVSLSSREGAVIPYKPKTAAHEYFKPPESMGKGDADYTFTEINIEIIDGPAPDRPTNPELWSSAGPGSAPTTNRNVMSMLPKSTLEALEKAKKEGRTVDAERLAKVVARLTDSIQMTKLEKFAAAIAVDPPRKGKDPDATDYHSIFPINDYPQRARWNVTSKEALVYLNEMAQASITMRGQYYAPGIEPPAGGEPKLYLLIESNDRDKVQVAVDEIRRRLIEGSMSALENADRGGGAAGGRYSV